MMRLRRFSLDLFGHFTAKSYDFGARPTDQPDFHVIYGPNEAGKTTTMEAYLRLLYGFPARDAYAFQHQRANLQVSGELEIDGTTRAFTRRSTRTGSLRDEHGTALPEAALMAHLGGLGEAEYRQLLCLDDETIERGGQEIVDSKGQIGNLLFGAASGISGLSAVLDHTRAEASALYRKGASTTRLIQLKKELAEIAKDIKASDITASAFHGLKDALDRAFAQEAEARAHRRDLRLRHAQTRAQAEALPLLAEIDGLDADLAGFAAYPAQLDIDPETLVELQSRAAQAHADHDRLSGDIARMTRARDAIERHPAQAALGAALDDLSDLLARDITAAKDLPRRRAALDAGRQDMARAARDCGAAEEVDPERLILSSSDISELEAAREARSAARAAYLRERAEVDRLATALRTATTARDAASANDAPQSAEISDILARFSIDTLAPDHAAAQQAIADARHHAETALDALSISGAVFSAVPACSLNRDQAQELATRHSEASTKVTQSEDALADCTQAHAALEAQRAAMARSTGVITDAEAQDQVRHRDALWNAHLASLTQATAIPFFTALKQVDATSNARLTQANAVAELRQLEQRLIAAAGQITQASDRLRIVTAARDEIAAQIDAARTGAGLPPGISPAAFAAWAQRRDTAELHQSRLARVTAQNQSVLDRADRLVAALSPLIGLDTPGFDTLVHHARDRQKRAQEHAKEMATHQQTCAALRIEHSQRGAAAEALSQQAQEADVDWRAAVCAKCHGDINPDILVDTLEPLRTLRALADQQAAVQRQVDGMTADQRAFDDALSALASAHGVSAPAPLGPVASAAPDAAHATVGQISPARITYQALRELADAAQDGEARHAALTRQINDAMQACQDAQASLAQIDQTRASLAEAFAASIPTDDISALRRAVSDAQRVITQRDRRAALRQQVCLGLNVATLDIARAGLEGRAATDLATDLADQESDLTAAERAYDLAIEARTTAENSLRAVTGDSDIARMSERKATIEAEIVEVARAYLTRDLGHRLAETAISRYRETHRSGMMAATERSFAALTNGAYPRLISQTEGTTETLIARAPSGATKQAQDMSKGTRFQLYLALRAAAYDQMANQGLCLPFFCDDIFETFDETRTKSACQVLAQIGQRGQAIYLTHHRHVVDIARAACGAGVRVHSL